MLNTYQIERLCNIAYLDVLTDDINKNSLAHIMDYMLGEGFGKEGTLPVLMTRQEWDRVALDIIADSELGGLFVAKFTDDSKTGHRAFCFTSGKQGGDLYIIFRGTHKDAEWFDNARGMFLAETESQKAALDFVFAVRRTLPAGKIIVAGHSKGGNKAQYCAIAAGDTVDLCVSVDGQGFSRLFFEKYNDIIESAKSRIISVAERRDFVNCLGFYLKKPEFYSGGRGDKSESFPYGQPLQYFHCPDGLRINDGSFGQTAQVSYISEAINSFVVFFLSEKKYAQKAEKIAHGLVSLMTESRHERQAAEALADAALIFFEFTAKSKDFREKLHDIFVNESDVIAATSHTVRNSNEGHNEIADTAMKIFAEKLLLKPRYFRYFITNIERYTVYTKKVKKGKEKARHVNHFIKGIFGHIEKLKHKK